MLWGDTDAREMTGGPERSRRRSWLDNRARSVPERYLAAAPVMPKSSGRLPQDLIFENSDLAKPGSHIDDLPHLGDAARLDPNEQGLIDIDASTGRLDTEERPVVDPGKSNPSSGCAPSRHDLTNPVPQLVESLVGGPPRGDLTIDPNGLDAAGRMGEDVGDESCLSAE